MPYKIENGRLTGTIEVPVEDASAFAIIKYCDLSGYTTKEISAMIGVSLVTVTHAIECVRKSGKGVILSHGKNGRRKGTKTLALNEVKQKDGFQGKLVRLMLARKETYSDLAAAIGVSPNTVRRWILLTRNPQSGNLRKIADHYNVQVAWLIGEKGAQPLRRW